jgi:hypothetical protein
MNIMKKLSQITFTLEELRHSGAAQLIGKLRKHPDTSVAAEAKMLRTKWIEVNLLNCCARVLQ